MLGACAAFCLLCIAPYVAFHRQAFLDGRAARPSRLFTTVAPDDELPVIEWLRRNVKDDQLVLGPPETASWLATVPMHSFASDYRYGITFPEQLRLASDFYQGKLGLSAAQELLNGYGVRYVVVPERSPSTPPAGSAWDPCPSTSFRKTL